MKKNYLYLNKIRYFILFVLLSGCFTSWQSHETENLIIYFEPDSYAAKNIDEVVKTFEASYQHTIDITGMPPCNGKLNIYLHTKLPWWHFGSSGHAKYGSNKVTHVYNKNYQLSSPHEMMHLSLHRVNPNVPYRFEEGFIRSFESISIRNKGSFPLVHLIKNDQSDPDNWTIEYSFKDNYSTSEQGNVAGCMALYIRSKMTQEETLEFYKSLSKKNYKTLLEDRLKMTEKEINNEFREFIRKIPAPLKANTKPKE